MIINNTNSNTNSNNNDNNDNSSNNENSNDNRFCGARRSRYAGRASIFKGRRPPEGTIRKGGAREKMSLKSV